MMKDLYIFIGNKLISTDTILPLAYELKKRKYIGEIYFITFHSTTYLDIKRNYTLFKAMNKIGKILFLGNSYKLSIAQVSAKKNKIKAYLFKQKAKIYLLKYFFPLVTKVFFKKAIIFHFSILDLFPFNLFFKIFESSVYKVDRIWETDLMCKASHLSHPPDFSNTQVPIGNLICFNKESNNLKDKRNSKKRKIYLSPTPNYSHWVSFLKKNYQDLINKELKKNNKKPNQQIITITLGSFTHFKYLKDENSVKNCLREVLEVIKILKKTINVEI